MYNERQGQMNMDPSCYLARVFCEAKVNVFSFIHSIPLIDSVWTSRLKKNYVSLQLLLQRFCSFHWQS